MTASVGFATADKSVYWIDSLGQVHKSAPYLGFGHVEAPRACIYIPRSVKRTLYDYKMAGQKFALAVKIDGFKIDPNVSQAVVLRDAFAAKAEVSATIWIDKKLAHKIPALQTPDTALIPMEISDPRILPAIPPDWAPRSRMCLPKSER